ncbi:rod shape-determining protein MreB [Lachnospiraceae bacterium]|nr:rod shape-determining protein MreB [Lachnospiraceae bacterium]
MYRIDMGIDLGTSKVCIYMRDKGIVINQPSVLAYERKEKKIIAVGYKAKKMLGKTTEAIVVEKPMQHGVISEYAIAERMIKAFIKNALRKRRLLGRPNVCVTVPQGITEVERRAVEDAIVKTGAKEIFLLESPIASALGTGVDIMETTGHMIVDIGGGTTEIAIISAGDIAYGISLKIGGDDFTDALARFVRRKYNIELGELSAEDAKVEIAGVYPRTVDSSYEIKGKSQINGLPVRLDLGANETVEAFDDLVNQIIDGIMKVLDQAETELIADVGKEGILLSGGGSLIYGMDKVITARTGIKVSIADEPDSVVAAGAGMAGEYIMVQDEENKK